MVPATAERRSHRSARAGSGRGAGTRCGAACCPRAACSGTDWSRSDTARSAGRTAGGSRPGYARRTRGFPGARPRRPAVIRGCGSNAPAVRGSALRPVRGTRCGRRRWPWRSGPMSPCILAFLLSAGARPARLKVPTPPAPRIGRCLHAQFRRRPGVSPVRGGPSPGRAPDTGRIMMGKIVVSQNVTLDGVVEDPSGEGGFRHGGWFVQFMGQDWEAWAELELAEAQGAEALLMGRRSDEYCAARSSIMSGEWLDTLNRLPKYVVSATLQEPRWTNATVLAGEA